MAEIRIKVLGANRVENKLRRLAFRNPDYIDPEIKAWGTATSKKLRKERYPPKRPGQTYVRTGQLGKRWQARFTKKGSVQFINLARQKGRHYASYVVGVTQAKPHKGRWWIARDIINREARELTKGMAKRVRELLS